MKFKYMIPFMLYSWFSAMILAKDVSQYFTLMAGLGISLLFTYKITEGTM